MHQVYLPRAIAFAHQGIERNGNRTPGCFGAPFLPFPVKSKFKLDLGCSSLNICPKPFWQVFFLTTLNKNGCAVPPQECEIAVSLVSGLVWGLAGTLITVLRVIICILLSDTMYLYCCLILSICQSQPIYQQIVRRQCCQVWRVGSSQVSCSQFSHEDLLVMWSYLLQKQPNMRQNIQKKLFFDFVFGKIFQFDTRQTTSPITGPTIQRHSQFVFPCSCSSSGTLLPLQESCHVNLLSFSAT